MGRKIIRRAHAIDLLHAIYKAEGWKRAEGESRVKRCKELYEITADPRNNRYVATPRPTLGPS